MRVFEEHRDDVALAILDLDLPKRSGVSSSQEMRRQRPDLPVLVVTGNIDRASREALGDGVPILAKPFRISELLELIDQVLGS